MLNINTTSDTTYHTLTEIRLRKQQLLTDISKDNAQMTNLWNGLMHRQKEDGTPSGRFSGLMSTGAGILDAAILGWKLYSRFSGKKNPLSLFKRKKR